MPSLRTIIGSSALALGLFVSDTTAAAPKCVNLTDPTAAIYTALPLLPLESDDLKNLPLNKLLAPIDAQMPWLSTCLASTDWLTIGAKLFTDPAKSKCLSAITSSSNDSAGIGFTDDYFSTTLCPQLKSTVLPCVDSLVISTLKEAITAGGECCTAMDKTLKELMGQDLDKFLNSMAIRVADVVCSTKTYKDWESGKEMKQTCGHAILDSVVSGKAVLDVTKMLQISNTEACDAMRGVEFTTTSGDSYQFFNKQNPLDSCFAPMNLLFTDMAKAPMFGQSKFSELFAEGKCMKGQAMIDLALVKDGFVMQVAEAYDGVVAGLKLAPAGQVTEVTKQGFKDMSKDFGSQCFHIANSVTDCVYNSSVVYAFSTDAPPPSQMTGGDNVPNPSSSASSVVGEASSFLAKAALTVGVIVFLFNP